jgi:hypothetical protein
VSCGIQARRCGKVGVGEKEGEILIIPKEQEK